MESSSENAEGFLSMYVGHSLPHQSLKVRCGTLKPLIISDKSNRVQLSGQL